MPLTVWWELEWWACPNCILPVTVKWIVHPIKDHFWSRWWRSWKTTRRGLRWKKAPDNVSVHVKKKPLSHTHSHTPCWQLISFLCGTGQGFLLEIFTWYIFVGTFAWSCETNNQSALLSQVNKAVQMCQILNQSGESLVSVTFEFSANV